MTREHYMKFKTKHLYLKTSEQVLIRMPRSDEAQKLLELKRGYIEDSTSLPLTLEDYPFDIEGEAEVITSYENKDNCILLVAEYQNELIGNIDLTGSMRSIMYHTAMLGMGIKAKWRNKGLGTLLINHIINWAKVHSKIELIWLDVYATNESGIQLYKKTGFSECGLIKDYFKHDGSYIDKIQMIQRIREQSKNI